MNSFWQGKKIVAFIALKHHTRFIIPIMENLAGKGADIIYVVGQGENPQEITAIDMGLRYTHVFDYVDASDMDDVRKNYHIQKDSIAAALKKDFVLSVKGVTIIDRALWAPAKEYIGFRNLFPKEKPDLCIALHELNRWGRMFGFWAKKNNVPFITLQEGLTYGQDFSYTGHVQYSTMGLVWGERVRNKFAEFEAPYDRIIPVGNTHLAREIESLRKNNIRDKKRHQYKCNQVFVVLLLFPPRPPSSDELKPLLEVFAKRKDLRFFIKWHPAAKKRVIDNWIEPIPKAIKKKIVSIHGEESTYDLMAMSDLCVVTTPSTTGLEALAIGRPLVKLRLNASSKVPYSFVQKGVAAPFTPVELANALDNNTDFAGLISRQAVDAYLKEELFDNQGVVERIVEIAKRLIQARENAPPSRIKPRSETSMKWTIVVPVHKNADILLAQLEAVAAHSDGQGEYGVYLLEPEGLTEDVLEILRSLSGDINRMRIPIGTSMAKVINKASQQAQGRTMLFLKPGVSPLENWLAYLGQAIENYGQRRLLGGHIENLFGNLVHAGMVLNPNNSPISAYQNLDAEFPNALKERSFQILDHFIAVDRNFFLELGGFWDKSGRYAFMDLCLRAKQCTGDTDVAMYLPKVRFVQLDRQKPSIDIDHDAAIHFYGRWHGVLWDNEDKLYAKDGISRTEVQAALMKKLVNLTQKENITLPA